MSSYDAGETGRLAVVAFHVSHGVDVNEAAYIEQTPLNLASWKGHQSVVEYLVTRNADVNKDNKSRETALWIASLYGHQSIVDTALLHAWMNSS